MTYVTVLTNGHNCRAAGNCRRDASIILQEALRQQRLDHALGGGSERRTSPWTWRWGLSIPPSEQAVQLRHMRGKTYNQRSSGSPAHTLAVLCGLTKRAMQSC